MRSYSQCIALIGSKASTRTFLGKQGNSFWNESIGSFTYGEDEMLGVLNVKLMVQNVRERQFEKV